MIKNTVNKDGLIVRISKKPKRRRENPKIWAIVNGKLAVIGEVEKYRGKIK